MSLFGVNPTYFPSQKKTEKEKNEKWFKECVDVGVGISQWNQTSFRTSNVRQSRRNKLINYNLRNDIIDRSEIERVINPYGLEEGDFPETYRNYPLINPAANLLSGEERRRIFNPLVTVINSDAITSKLRELDEMFDQIVVQNIIAKQFDEEKTKKEIQEYDKFRNYTYKDKRERMANQVLKYLYQTQDLAKEFSSGFEDLLIAGEEIYVIEIIGGEPVMRKGNPLNFYTLRSGSSSRIEDSNIIVEDCFMPIGRVIDRYHEYLSSENIDYLESGHNTHAVGNSAMFSNQLVNTPNINSILQDVQVVDDWNNISGYYNGAFDPEGNIRVINVKWKGMRKVGFITRFNEFGEEVRDIVPEQYKPNKELGEEVKWEWISEWYEGTRIGADIYVKMEPCEVQMRHRDNISVCMPNVVGTIFTVNSNVARSLYDEAKDLQYLYNLFMYRTEQAFIKYKGKIARLPLHLVPDGWTVEKWLYYAETMGWAVVDAFNESNKAAFRGKPAGMMNEGAPVMDLEMGNYIQNHIMMLEFIERRLDNLTGITPQRKGSIDNRETVGGVERSVQQSSNITEKWFDVHDFTRKRALRALLEAAKIAWQGKSFVREFVLDDGTKQLLDFDSEVFYEASYGVDVTNSSEDMQAIQAMRALGERFLQAGGSMSIVAELYRTKSLADLQRKIQTYEENQQQAASEQAQREQQLAEAQLQIEENRYQDELDLEYEKLDREDINKQLDRENDIYLEEIKAMSFDPTKDANMNAVPDVLEQGKLALENTRVAFEQSTKIKELSDKKTAEDKKIALEEKKMKHAEKLQKMKEDGAMRREKLKARTSLKNKTSGEK